MAARILLVEDEAVIAMWMDRLLQDAGFQVRCEFTEAAALVAAAEYDPAAIFINFDFPDSSHGQTARLLRRRYPQLPIILTTSFERSIVEPIARELQLWVLRKPFSEEHLLETLTRMNVSYNLPRLSSRD